MVAYNNKLSYNYRCMEKKINKIVRLKDIAEIAGISINSVSRALKGSPNISKETQKRVQEIAENLGYIPNIHAQSLKLGSIKVIAIIYDEVENPFYSMMLGILQQQLFERGYEAMIFIDSRSYGHLSENIANKIVHYRLSGVITFLAPTSKASEVLKNNNIPVVLVGRDGKLTETSSVFSKDYQGGKIAAENLLALNGKEFCYITEHAELNIDSQRCNGFKNYLIKQGVNNKNIHVIIGNLEVNAMKELEKLVAKTKIDSIFCFSDLIAYSVIEKLTELNIKVPKDINVIGYDNLQDYIPYPLKVSSIDNCKHKMISEALDILFDQITNNIVSEPVYKKINVDFNPGYTTQKK